MASKDQHLAKAERNQAFLDSLDDRYPEWLAVVAFYKAVHLVEALFATQGVHSKRHHERNKRLKSKNPDLWMQFRPLHDVSRQVRYHPQGISAADVRNILIGRRLQTLEGLVRAKLKVAAPAPALPGASTASTQPKARKR